MALLYLDEGLSFHTQRRLIELGNDVVHARSILHDGTSDHHHLATATRQHRLLITYNRIDFVLLHLAWRDWFDEFGVDPRPSHSGVLVVPQPPVMSAVRAADLIYAFVVDVQQSTFRNQLFIWRVQSGWNEIAPEPAQPPRSERP